jgi:hypothetical protein
VFKCPECGKRLYCVAGKSRNKNKRKEYQEGYYRHYRCKKCNYHTSTIEVSFHEFKGLVKLMGVGRNV